MNWKLHKPFKLTKVSQSGSFSHSHLTHSWLYYTHSESIFWGSITSWKILHFITQPCVSASFVLAKFRQTAKKLLPFSLTEFSTTAAQAQPPSSAKGRGAWKGCLSHGISLNNRASTGQRNNCHRGRAEVLHWDEKRSRHSFRLFHGITILTF